MIFRMEVLSIDLEAAAGYKPAVRDDTHGAAHAHFFGEASRCE